MPPVRRRPLRAVLLSAALLLPGGAALAEGGGTAPDDRPDAQALVRGMEGLEGERLWIQAGRLSASGASAVPAIRSALESASPWARLGLGRALLDLGERNLAQETLLALSDPATPREVRANAIGLLGSAAASIADADGAAKALERVLGDELDPVVKLSLWRTLLALTKHPDWAREMQRAMAATEDAALKEQAALLLADAGYVDEVKSVLTRLAAEPSERGRWAAALLKGADAANSVSAYRVEIQRLKRAAAAASAATTGSPEGGPSPAAQRPERAVPGWDPALLQNVLHTILGVAYDAPALRDPAAVEAFVRERIERAARGLASGLDPNTVYFDAKDREGWNRELDKVYGGIGAYVELDQEGVFSIKRPMFGAPAWHARLQPGDRILEIDGWSTLGKQVDEIISHLKGPPGTDVRVRYHRRGWSEARELVITRARIEVPASWATMLPGNIGFIELENFSYECSEEIRRHVADLESRGMKGLVLNLRWNGGGLLEEAVHLAGLFLEGRKLVVTTKGRVFPDEPLYTDPRRGPVTRVPLVILVNGGSASASEILAGALRNHGRTVLVGERTFGKGSVQHAYPILVPPFSEEWTDLPRDGRGPNGRWDAPDEYDDLNRNGKWDAGERLFRDYNDNGRFDDGEPFTDRNGNGKFDFPALKVTIAKYFLPDGTSPEREKRRNRQGRDVWIGGIEPDHAVRNDDLEGWRVEEAFRCTEHAAFTGWLDRVFTEERDLAIALARSDGGGPDRYPRFDELHAALETPLSKRDLWLVLRARLRLRASDTLGQPLLADFETDAQLQKALLVVLEKMGVPAASVAEYAGFAHRVFAAPEPVDDLLPPPPGADGDEGR